VQYHHPRHGDGGVLSFIDSIRGVGKILGGGSKSWFVGYGKRGITRAYNEGLGALPRAGSRHPGQVVGGRSPPESERNLAMNFNTIYIKF